MKNKRLIILTVINIILIIIILNLILRTQMIKAKEVLKDMTLSEEGNELELQINNLNEAHEQYAINVQNNKKQIAEAITEMGVETLETESIDTIKNNIKSIKNNKEIYSTEEVKTNELWIDGKTIYRKTIVADINQSNQNFSIQHEIENIGDFRAVDYAHSFLIRKTTKEYVPIPQIATVIEEVNRYQVGVTFINDEDIMVQSGPNQLGSWTITINYTKTTD